MWPMVEKLDLHFWTLQIYLFLFTSPGKVFIPPLYRRLCYNFNGRTVSAPEGFCPNFCEVKGGISENGQH